jgi:hypothetical protein
MKMRLILTIAVLAGTLAACGGGGSLTATFDGETCTYSGPDSVKSEDVETTFDNRSGKDAALALLSLQDESARADEMAMIGQRLTDLSPQPGSQTQIEDLIQASSGEEATRTTVLAPGTYFLDCVTFANDAADEVWRAAAVEIVP